MATIKLFGGDLGAEIIMIQCDLSRAEAAVRVCYDLERGFEGTQWQCADARHRVQGLARLGKEIAATAVEMDEDQFNCEWEELVICR